LERCVHGDVCGNLQVYHPNIDLDGNVCLNILREDWKPVLSINSIIYGLQYLFLVRMPSDVVNQQSLSQRFYSLSFSEDGVSMMELTTNQAYMLYWLRFVQCDLHINILNLHETLKSIRCGLHNAMSQM
jgi:hypothetical protein